MAAATAAARGTLAAFAARVASPAPAQSYAGVKVPLREGERVEHVWMSDLRYDGDAFRGRLGNAPVELTRWRVGDSVRVARDSVSDWMLIVHDTVYGGYSVHLLRSRMIAEQRAVFDREQGLAFPAAPKPAP